MTATQARDDMRHHHVYYKELDGYDAVVHLTEPEHRRFHLKHKRKIPRSVQIAAKNRLRLHHDETSHQDRETFIKLHRL